MFVKFNYRDFKNVEIIFSELKDANGDSALSASEVTTLNKAREILKLLSLAKERNLTSEGVEN